MVATDPMIQDLANKYFRPVAPAVTQPVATAVAAPAEKKDEGGGAVDAIFGGLGKVAHVAGEALDLSGKYIARPLLGAATKAAASDGVVGDAIRSGAEFYRDQPLQVDLGPVDLNLADLMGGRVLDKIAPDSEEERIKILEAASLTDSWRERSKSLSWVESLLSEVAADPTTWITAGTVGAVGKLPMIADLAAKNAKVARTLLNLEQGAGLLERAQALPLTAPIAGAKKLINSDVATKVIGRGEPLLGQSAKSKLVESTEKADTAVRNLTNRGVESTGGTVGGALGVNADRGVRGLVNSNLVQSARQNKELLASVANKTQFLRDLKAQELDSLYNIIDSRDPLFNDVRMELSNRGYIRPTKNKIPGAPTYTINGRSPTGFEFTTTKSGRREIDVDIERAKEFRNNPYMGTATAPKIETVIAGGRVTEDVVKTADNVLKFVKEDIGLGPASTAPWEGLVRDDLVQRAGGTNPERISVANLWSTPETRADLGRAMTAGSEQEARTHLALAYHRINAKQSAYGVMHPAASRFFDRFLPNIRKTSNNIKQPRLGSFAHFNSVLDDDDMHVLELMFRNDEVKKFQAAYDKERTEIGAILQGIPNVTNMTDTTTARDLAEAAAQIADPKQKAKVDAFLKKYGMTEQSFTEQGARSLKSRISRTQGAKGFEDYTVADAWTDKLIDKWAKQEALRLGIKADSADKYMNQMLAWVPKAWREQALISPRYHFANILDMSVKSLIYGVNPVRSMNGEHTALSVGIKSLPRSVFVGDESTTFRQFGDLSEFVSSAHKSVLPGPLGSISQFNRALARGSENAFREWAWSNGLKDALHNYKPILHEEIRRAFGLRTAQADSFIAELEATGTTSTIRGKSFNIARDNGIKFTPDQVRDMALSHGASTDVANRLQQNWGAAVNAASDNGVNMANRVHFDFDKTFNIEDKLFLKKWMPFHFFATRNIPFYMETLANRPELVNAMMAYNDISEQDRIEMGLSERFTGMVPVGDGFLSRILGGSAGEMFFNPMAAISYADQMKNANRAVEGSASQESHKLLSRQGIGEVIDRASDLGVGGVAPWVQIPLSIVGVSERGARDETMPILRHSQLTEAYLGTDLGEGVARDVIGEARAVFHNGERVETKTGSQFRDNQIVTRLQEQMQTMIDKGMSPDAARELFTTASKEGPGNRLWDDAASKVGETNKDAAKRNFWFPLPTKEQTVQGQQIDTARNSLPEGTESNTELMNLMKHFGLPAAAHKGFARPQLVDRQGEIIWRNDSKTPQKPTTKYADNFQWGGPVWGPDKAPPFNNYLAFEGFKQWSDTAPKEANNPQDYFNVYGIR